jgi:hypothetical protein
VYLDRGRYQLFRPPVNCFRADLGRYGPFRKIDRKPNLHFDIKTFLFGHKPSEWCFGVNEKLFGQEEQLVDITDDCTGNTHDIARVNIPMYVNEVGHNKKLVHNVESRDDEDRSVHYYINIVEPMKQGQSVELLTDYFDTYEDVRERKGYGKKNLTIGLKSDEHLFARMERNCGVRQHLEDELLSLAAKLQEEHPKGRADDNHKPKSLNIQRMYELMEFIEECIRVPLVAQTDHFLSESETTSDAPSCRQWVALMRLQWLGSFIPKFLDVMEQTIETSVERMLPTYPWRSMLVQCRKWAGDMKWQSFSRFFQLDEGLTDSCGDNIRDAVCAEIVETICYDLKDEIPRPFDPFLWCPVAQELLSALSRHVAIDKWHTESTGASSAHQQELLQKFFFAASHAAGKIREAAANVQCGSTDIAFDSGVDGDIEVRAVQLAKFEKNDFEGNSMNPKALVAAFAEMLAYFDSATLADDHDVDEDFAIPVETKAQFLMMACTRKGFRKESPMTAVPRTVDRCLKATFEVNEAWYLVWQVAYITNAFARKFLPFDLSATATINYSLEQLCSRLGVDTAMVKQAVARGVEKRTLFGKQITKKQKKRKASSLESKKASKKARKDNSKSSKSVNKKASRAPPAVQVLGASPNSSIVTGPNGRPAAREVWRGRPDEPMEGGWPPGWRKTLVQRVSGATAGHTDRYWHTPQKRYKLRSMVDVKRFMAALKTVGGDEVTAWRWFKTTKS